MSESFKFNAGFKKMIKKWIDVVELRSLQNLPIFDRDLLRNRGPTSDSSCDQVHEIVVFLHARWRNRQAEHCYHC